jgi:hypothetical protein
MNLPQLLKNCMAIPRFFEFYRGIPFREGRIPVLRVIVLSHTTFLVFEQFFRVDGLHEMTVRL